MKSVPVSRFITAFTAFIIMLALFLFTSCNSDDTAAETTVPDTETARVLTDADVASLTVEVDREETEIGSGKPVKMNASAFAEDGTPIPNATIEYYVSGQKIDNEYFVPIETGFFNLYVCCGDIRSDSIEIKVSKTKIIHNDFSLNGYAFTTGSEVKFIVRSYTNNGLTHAASNIPQINGKPAKSLVYKATSPGIYSASVISDGMESAVKMFSVSDKIKYSLRLNADKTVIYNNPDEKITFTSTAEMLSGEPLDGVEAHLMLWGEGEVADTFTPSKPGCYSFYLECDGEVSPTVLITVKENTGERFNGENSELPVIVIDTNGASIRSRETAATVYIYDNGGVNCKGDLPTAVTQAEIKLRGQSSLGFVKKQYSLHTVNSDGSNNNLALCGLPKENDWVLNGSYADKSLIRNSLAQSLFSSIITYAPRTAYCEVYLQDESGALNYVGVYTLLEKIKIDRKRLDIDKLTAEDNDYPEITGGYIVSFDKIKGGENTVETQLGIMTIVKPSAENITPEQDAYIKDYLIDFANALRNDRRSDPETGYRAFLEPESTAAALVMTEWLRNIDGFAISTFFYKERDGKLSYGPSWDYDLTMGNADYNEGHLTDGWYVIKYSSLARNLMRDDYFVDLFIDSWEEMRNGILSDDAIDAAIDEQVEAIGAGAIARSCARWIDHWNGNYVWPNHLDKLFTATYYEEIESIRSFLHARAEWIDDNIDELYNNK